MQVPNGGARLEGERARRLAVGVVGGIDVAVAEKVVLGGVCAGESERGGGGGDVEAETALYGGGEFAGVDV